MIILKPFWPWSQLTVLAALLSIGILCSKGIVDYVKRNPLWQTLGGSKGFRFLGILFFIVSAVLLGMTALNPHWIEKPDQMGFHLQVVLDVSESVLRAEGGWEKIKDEITNKMNESISAMESRLLNQCTTGIITFRGNTNEAFKKKPLVELTKIFAQVDDHLFASGEGTNIEKSLKKALTIMEQTGRQGAVLLISDGNQTKGNALKAAQQLALRGIPIHIFPITSQAPAIAITDADLPRYTYAKVRTHLRGLLLNRNIKDQKAKIQLTKNTKDSLDNQFSLEQLSSSQQISLPSNQWVRLRWPIIFNEFGLHYIDLSLIPIGSPNYHCRRFYTYVKSPPKILAIGGDNRWIDAIPGDLANIITVTPNESLKHIPFKNIDAVTISGIPSQQMPLPTMVEIAESVQNKGMGFLLINGGHINSNMETETVVMSYANTPIESLLPVIGGPRPFQEEPASRQVAILIDTSGSMNLVMWKGKFIKKIDKAKEIAIYIISELLRPKDRLDLITFTTGAGHLIKDRLMDEQGKQDAISQINRICAQGGTDPNRALAAIGNRKMKECGLIFISDGEFGYIGYRPDCRTTVFEIGANNASPSNTIKKLADPIAVGPNFDPKAISIPYFEPKERIKFFEEGIFQPLSMEKYIPKNQRVPVPPIDLKGSAVSYLKENAILNGVRPKLTDPILAFKQAGEGFVGFFASKIPEKWTKLVEGQKAIQAWISRLIPFMERNRYDFYLEDQRDEIFIRISLVSKSGKIPDVNHLSAMIQFPHQHSKEIALQSDETAPGTFHGYLEVERSSKCQHGLLMIKESGPDALPRSQKIPIAIPPRDRINPIAQLEDYTYGQNRKLLTQIAEMGGGKFDPPQNTPFFKENPLPGRGLPLWPYLLMATMIFYLGAIAIKRLSL